MLFKWQVIPSHEVAAPVIIVGNITVGGTGKTPFVLWLCTWLRQQGFVPGIITRGIGGQKHLMPRRVTDHDCPSVVGDEALLLQRHSQGPVVVCADKIKAAHHLTGAGCNVIISDDGLQHYRLKRQVEINMIDGVRRFGNRRLLPAGPLREPISRLKTVDLVVVNEGNAEDAWQMHLVPKAFVSVKDPRVSVPLSTFADQTIHAVAAIGHPQRFFNQLAELKLKVISHAFIDHHLFKARDLDFNDNLTVIMTEKDAVKCERFAKPNWWYLQSEAELNLSFSEKLLQVLHDKGAK